MDYEMYEVKFSSLTRVILFAKFLTIKKQRFTHGA